MEKLITFTKLPERTDVRKVVSYIRSLPDGTLLEWSSAHIGDSGLSS